MAQKEDKFHEFYIIIKLVKENRSYQFKTFIRYFNNHYIIYVSVKVTILQNIILHGLTF